MSDRTVSYEFRGKFTNLTAGLTAAGKSVGDLGTKLTALDKSGTKARAGLTTVGNAAGKFGLVAAVGLGAMVKSAADFDQAMANVRAATHETANNMDLLREAALKAGADTAYSATEAAGAIEELSKAGVSTKDILGGGLSGSLSLAAAGALDVGKAAEIAASALTQFQLKGTDVEHVADLLAAGAGKAQGSVTDLGAALNQSGLIAAQTGLSIEETTGALAAFASAGLIGSDAGTSFKTFLQSLTPSSKAAQVAMDDMGFSAYDAQGNFKGLTAVAGDLQSGLSTMTVEQQNATLKTIFGSDAVRAASIIYKDGADGIQGWIDKTNDSGYAAETAAIRMDSLKGDLEQLGGSLETLLITGGSGSQGFLRGLVQNTTSAVNALNKMPDSARNATTGLLAITAVTGGGLFLGSRVINSIANTKEALDNLGASGTKASAALKGIGVAGGVVAGLYAVGAAFNYIEQKSDKALPSVDALTKSILALGSAQAAKDLTKDVGDLGAALDKVNASGVGGLRGNLQGLENGGGILGNTLKGISKFPVLGIPTDLAIGDPQDLREAAASIQAVDEALANIATTGGADQAQQAFTALAAAQGLSADEQKELLASLPAYQGALDSASNSATLAAGATDGLASSTAQAGSVADAAAADIDEVVKALDKQYAAALGAFDAVTQYRQAMKDAAEQAKKSDAGIKGSSDEALKNRDSLSALAGAWNNQSDAVKNAKGNFAAAQREFVATATAMGVPQRAAEKLADTLLEIPPKRAVQISVNADAARQVINGIEYDLRNLKDKTVYINTINRRSGPGGQGPAATVRAAGGYIAGPGSGTSDSIPARLSNGEYVIQAKAVSRYGVAMFDSLNAQRFASGGSVNKGQRARSKARGAYGDLDVDLGLTAEGVSDALDKFQEDVDHVRDLYKDAHLSLTKAQRDEIEAVRKSAREFDGLTTTVKAAKDAQAAYGAEVGGNFNNDIFGQGLSGAVAQLQADAADAGAFQAALSSAVSQGLSGDLLKALGSSGDLVTAQELASSGAGGIANLQTLFKQRQDAQSSVGSYASGVVFAGDLAKASSDLAKETKELREELKKLGDRVERGARDGSQSGTREGNKDRDTATTQAGRTGGRGGGHRGNGN